MSAVISSDDSCSFVSIVWVQLMQVAIGNVRAS